MASKKFRFLQSGDIHVGRGRSSWGQERSLKRAEKLFDALYEAAHEQKCNAVVIAGDVFDQKHVTNEEREVVSRKLTQHSATMPTYVTSGNHDLKSATNSNLDFLAEITENTDQIPNLHVAFSNQETKWDVADGLCMWGVSCPLSENQQWIEDAVQEVDASKQYVFIGHATIKGCTRNDFGWKPDDDKDRGVSLAEASKANHVIYWAFGDIHKRQKLPTLAKGANGWYAGSPVQMDFGEEPDRGALMVALEDNGDGWFYKGKRYVRIDDKGFTPLVTVRSEEDLDDLPEKALIRLEKGLVLPSARHEQVVSSLPVVEDRSTPEIALTASGASDLSEVSLEAFDPLLSSIQDVEDEVLEALETDDSSEAKRMVALAVERFRERTFVS